MENIFSATNVASTINIIPEIIKKIKPQPCFFPCLVSWRQRIALAFCQPKCFDVLDFTAPTCVLVEAG